MRRIVRARGDDTMAKSTKEEAEAVVDALVEEWVETPPLRGVIIEVKVKRRDTGEILASGEVRCGSPAGR
jgi:hypothetical protein